MNTRRSGISGTSSWRVLEDGSLHISAGTLGETPFSQLLRKFSTKVTSILFSEDGTTALPPDCSYLFAELPNVVNIYGLNRVDTSRTTDMSAMFRGAKSLTTLDLSGWDTSNVEFMGSMFEKTRSLTNLDISQWNTSKVTSMSAMFRGAKSLTTLDLSGWDTSTVEFMGSMFEKTRSLTNLDISQWNTSNVVDMTSMFSGRINPEQARSPAESRQSRPLPIVDQGSERFDEYMALLARAREQYQVPILSSVDDVRQFLVSLDAVPLDYEKYHESLADEFVDRVHVVGAFTLYDPALLSDRANRQEREAYGDDDGSPLDPLQYGPEEAEWTTFAYEVERLQRLHIIIENLPDDPEAPGNFRVHGGGQWLRESLWAGTGIVPRDVGPTSDESALFGQAFDFVGREKFAPEEI